MALRIVSYNLNGIRSALSKGLLEWLDQQSFDIIGFQETKAWPDQVDMSPFLERGYHASWHSAEKKGYSGVLTLSRRHPDHVQAGMGIPEYDREGRILRTDYGDLTVLNCYFPSGTTGDIRQAVKMRFLEDFYQWAHELRRQRPNLVIFGDYNIAHTERDIHDPKGNKNSSGFLPEEREWMSRWFSSGFRDSFREKHPDTVGYSWWSFRANARANNKGWRIDYQSISDLLLGSLRAAGIEPGAVHSDHCPVWLELDVQALNIVDGKETKPA
jgi:exodeoxyribonuclease III